jgi:hypothetical protein
VVAGLLIAGIVALAIGSSTVALAGLAVVAICGAMLAGAPALMRSGRSRRAGRGPR